MPRPKAKNEDGERHSPPPASQPQPSAQSPQELAFLEYAKAANADRYRVTVIKMGEDGSRKVFIRDKKDGYKPAAIIESSIRNFQCILTIPKFGGKFDRQIANQLTAMLKEPLINS